jgi:hypothetical protein
VNDLVISLEPMELGEPWFPDSGLMQSFISIERHLYIEILSSVV